MNSKVTRVALLQRESKSWRLKARSLENATKKIPAIKVRKKTV